VRVLIVDDNSDSAGSLAMPLKMSGHDVRAEYSGAAALRAAGEHQPDVVPLGLSMPVRDGLEVAARLRQRLDMSKVVLFAMTGYGQGADRRLTKGAGFAYHLVKPVDFQQLHDLLAVLADDQHSRDRPPGRGFRSRAHEIDRRAGGRGSGAGRLLLPLDRSSCPGGGVAPSGPWVSAGIKHLLSRRRPRADPATASRPRQATGRFSVPAPLYDPQGGPAGPCRFRRGCPPLGLALTPASAARLRRREGAMTTESRSTPPLRDGEEQYRLLMENVKDYGIFLLDTQGRVVTWNAGAERTLGYKEAEIVGQPFARIFTPEDIDQEQPEHELRTAAEKGRVEDERWHVRKDGSRFWASGVVTPLWDEGGRLRGFAKILRDITERKRTEEELADANRRKDEFLAMLGHELRNPLAPVLNGLRLLEREGQDHPAIRQTVAMIDRQMGRVVRLVDDLLDVARITKGKIQLRRSREQLGALVAHAVEGVRPLVESRKHTLSVSVPPAALWLDADPTRIEQVLANLLNNAAKYTEPGGHIGLTVEQEGKGAVVRVRDTGIGIRADMLNRIFDLFVQSDRTLDRAQGGLGIGLTLVRKLAEMHGGAVEARSEGIGKGSEFVLRLPVLPEVKELEPEALPEVRRRDVPPLRVLVVDDNVDTAESLAMLLRYAGHEVRAAHTGPRALQAAQAEPPDVIVLDIGLPGMDGYEVARRLREQQGAGRGHLIAMTGYGQDSDRKRSQEAGFDHHLVKPVDPARLQELLGTLCKPG
jgi:PAS domain S-box-containing protein